MPRHVVDLGDVGHARLLREPRAADPVPEPAVVVTDDQFVSVLGEERFSGPRDPPGGARGRLLGRMEVHALVDREDAGGPRRTRTDHVDALEVPRELALHREEGTLLADHDLPVARDHQEAHARSSTTIR